MDKDAGGVRPHSYCKNFVMQAPSAHDDGLNAALRRNVGIGFFLR